MKARDLITNYGGRRFLLTVGSGIVCTLLLMEGYLSESIFRDLIIATVAVYISANTFQKYSDNRDKYNTDNKDG